MRYNASALTAEFATDKATLINHVRRLDAELAKLPPKTGRDPAAAQAAKALLEEGRSARTSFMRLHARAVYDSLTANRSKFVRVDDLCAALAKAFPGLTPDEAALARESNIPQGDKDGLEVDQGIFLSQVLGDPLAGAHLCHAMLLPRQDSLDHLKEFEKKGEIEFPGARLTREGKAAVLTMRNPKYLNAEDEGTMAGMEIATDLALLDPATEVCVLRGDVVTHTKHAGKRLFGAGINLTHLYQGKIRFLWYMNRDLGMVNKFYRGLAKPEVPPEENSIEKLWIAAVEGFAIGGHCQILLTMDQVIATKEAYMTLPARKEGIIPGAANLRLPRHIGPRLARQAILAERRIDCASPEGRLICDHIVAPDAMDFELKRLVRHITGSGVVSAASNRRALRISEEPLDSFRRYMAVYAREQAHCHFSPALIANLELHWNAESRKGT